MRRKISSLLVIGAIVVGVGAMPAAAMAESPGQAASAILQQKPNFCRSFRKALKLEGKTQFRHSFIYGYDLTAPKVAPAGGAVFDVLYRRCT